MPDLQTPILIALAVALCGLLGWVIALQIRLRRMTRRYTSLMRGAEGLDLQALLNQHVADVHQALETVSALEQRTETIEQALPHALQWVGFIRFNPFRNTGGAQSFALALVDDRGNGLVLSSLHARENTRVYSKPLREWASEHMLTEEEKQAIERAQRQRALARTAVDKEPTESS
jgi:hypothetical protein